MRILIFLLSLVAGAGLIAFSYISAFIRMAELTGADIDAGNPLGAFLRVMAFVNSGEVPQMMSFLYLGAFLIVTGFVYMIFGESRNTNDE